MSVQIKGVGTIGGIDQGLNTVGVITATSFVGSGANLTNLPAQATIANNADNRVITGGSGVNLNGEATLTYDGNTLQNLQSSNSSNLTLKATSNSFNSLILDSNRSANTQFAILDGRWNGTAVSRIQFVTGSDGSNKDDGYMAFHTRESGQSLDERLRITSGGQVNIGGRYGETSALLSVTGASKGFPSDSAIPEANFIIKTNSTNNRWIGIGASNTAGWIQATGPGSSGPTAKFCLNPAGGKIGINETNPQQQLHVHDDNNYQGILINGNSAPRIAFARSTTTTGEWSVGIDGTDGGQFVINNSNDNSARKFIVSSSGVTAAGTITSGGNATFNGDIDFTKFTPDGTITTTLSSNSSSGNYTTIIPLNTSGIGHLHIYLVSIHWSFNSNGGTPYYCSGAVLWQTPHSNNNNGVNYPYEMLSSCHVGGNYYLKIRNITHGSSYPGLQAANIGWTAQSGSHYIVKYKRIY